MEPTDPSSPSGPSASVITSTSAPRTARATPWYRRALRSGIGRIHAGGVDRAVTLTPVGAAESRIQEAVDAAYHAKYDRYGPRIVGSVVGKIAHQGTLRIDPR